MTAVLFNPKERIRFMRFAIVGIIGAVVDFGVSNLLIQVFSTPLVIAGSISFIAAILSNFYWNRRWTYPDSRSKPISAQLVQFALVSVIGLVIRIPVLAFLEPVMVSITHQFNLQIPGILDTRILADNLTLAVAVIIVMFWNFFANRYWTYGDVE
jgi:putative flippase GtrA